MAYKPRIIKGRVHDTGYPIDGCVCTFSQWDTDQYSSYHLWNWEPKDDEKIMQTMYKSEKDAGIDTGESFNEYARAWRAGKWDSDGVLCLPLDKVEELEELSAEKKENLAAALTPRRETDRGGIVCLPLDKNLNGDIKAKHPDWTAIKCPKCRRKCWKPEELRKLQKEQRVTFMCTECAVKAGLLAPYKLDSKPNPAGNREQRRRANREKRR